MKQRIRFDVITSISSMELFDQNNYWLFDEVLCFSVFGQIAPPTLSCAVMRLKWSVGRRGEKADLMKGGWMPAQRLLEGICCNHTAFIITSILHSAAPKSNYWIKNNAAANRHETLAFNQKSRSLGVCFIRPEENSFNLSRWNSYLLWSY